MDINPQVIKKNGKNEFVVLPYKEFEKILGLLEDYEDLVDLRKARAESADESSVPLDKVVKELELD